jgi:hypothetical protein
MLKSYDIIAVGDLRRAAERARILPLRPHGEKTDRTPTAGRRV